MEGIPPNMAALIYWWQCYLLKFFSSSTFKIDEKFSGQDLGKKEAKLAWSTINWWIYLRCIVITCNNISFYLNFICGLKRSKRTWENVRRYVYCNHDKHELNGRPLLWPTVQNPVSTPFVGWICCWFSPLLWEDFFQVLPFSPLFKNQHLQIPIQPGISANGESLCGSATAKGWFSLATESESES